MNQSNNNTANLSARDLLKKAWIQSGAYRTESLTAYIDRVMGLTA